jgi:PKD repeat protein
MSLALMDDMKSHIHKVWMARDRTAEIDNYLRVDVYEIAYQISLQFPEGSPVHEAATEVMESFEDMVVYNRWHTGIENAGINVSTAKGLGLYFVRDSEVHWVNSVEAYRSRLHFCLETHWINFLDDYFSYAHSKSAYAAGDAWIGVWSTGADLDADGYVDDMWAEVWSSEDEPLRDVSIYVNGGFWGKTNEEGWFAEFNMHEGDYVITAIYNEYSATTRIHVEGAHGYEVMLDAYGMDLDGDGWEDDVYIHLHDSHWEPIAWTWLYSDFGHMGWTNENGQFWGFNYKEGSHIVRAIVWGDRWAIDQFYSEGEGGTTLDLDPNVIDYSNDGEVNDLDLTVRDFESDLLDGAAVYLDDEYVGETYNGRIMKEDCEDGWHWADVYYKEEEVKKEAWFEDIYVRRVDLNNDSLEESVTVYYDVQTKEAAMDVRVTEQIWLWNNGEIRGIFYDNFTAVRGQEDYRYINYTTDRTRFINITLTLMDEDGYVMDSWDITAMWLEAAQNEPPEARLFVRPTYTYLGDVVCFNASTSTDPEDNLTMYFFDFGDGTTSGWVNTSVVNHTYSAAGNYTTYAMVKDDLGLIDDMSNRITVWVREHVTSIEPTARLFVRPTYTYPWEPVGFNATTSEDEDGEVVMYMFNFGDGTVSGWTNSSAVEHTYNKPGNYTAYVMVMDDMGLIDDMSNKITVWVRDEEGNQPPHAYFTARPSKVDVNETVTFNASGSKDEDGYVYKYYYDFGDGTNSGWIFDPITTHQYAEPGYYTATLMVEDDLEALSEWSTPRGIDVQENILPRPYLFARPHYVLIDEDVTFNASGSWDEDGNVVLYLFDFGDGTTSGWTSEPVLVHRYSEPGNYTIVVSVQDDSGGISRSTSRSTVTVKKEEKADVMESPALTALVIALFVILMIAGSWYEMKKVRLKSYETVADEEAVATPSEEKEEEEEEEDEIRGKLKHKHMHGDLEAHDDGEPAEPEPSEDEEEEEEGDEGEVGRGADGLHMHGEIDAHDGDHYEVEPEPVMIRVRCSGCNSVIEIEQGPRPMRIRCKSCGKKGVLR